MRSAVAALLMVLTGLGPTVLRADTVTLAVAANFLDAAERIVADWSAETGHQVRIIPGSSGKHAAMILNGGPVDLFLSADTARPDALEAAGLVRRRAPYAVGRLVVWAPGSNAPSLYLRDLRFRRVAVADAALAPYGQAADQTLASLGLTEPAAARRVIGENIGQTFGFVATGNADVGLVALSQVLAFDGADPDDWEIVNAALHDPIRQDMVLTTRAGPAAEALFDHLRGAEVRAHLPQFGYGAPAP